MFYFLSKLFVFLLRPITWVLILLIIGFFSKKTNRKRIAIITSILILFFFSNPVIYQFFSKQWSAKAIDMTSIETPYDIGIVLGGYSSTALNMNERIHLTEAATRLTTALELYKKGYIKKILITSGVTGVTIKRPSEAVLSKDFLLLTGVKEEDIILETKSRNTYENAKYTAELVTDKYPNSKCLVLTSAYHIRRSKACFQKTNLDFEVFPTELHERSDNVEFFDKIFPQTKTLYYWDRLIKEWVGMIMYRIKGYI